jgi:zinc transporter 2
MTRAGTTNAIHNNSTRTSENEHHGHSHGGEGEEENINIKAALIHVIGDAIQNLGVVIAGLIIYIYPDCAIADPICTYIFSVIVLFTTIRIMKQCVSVLMEEAPVKMDIDQLKLDLEALDGCVECHDLHVWALSNSKISLSCHLSSKTPQDTLQKALNLCKHIYKIKHCTIQVEEFEENHVCDDHGIH